MEKLFEKILGSLDNGDNGASGKKMTALVITITCLVFPTLRWSIWAYCNNDWSLLTTIIGLYIGFDSSIVFSTFFIASEISFVEAL